MNDFGIQNAPLDRCYSARLESDTPPSIGHLHSCATLSKQNNREHRWSYYFIFYKLYYIHLRLFCLLNAEP